MLLQAFFGCILVNFTTARLLRAQNNITGAGSDASAYISVYTDVSAGQTSRLVGRVHAVGEGEAGAKRWRQCKE